MPSQLPPECLHLIINHLVKSSDPATLGALLLVNKTVCQVTLPHVYSNPLRLLKLNASGSVVILKFRQLIRLLLTTSVPYDDYSDLLKAMYEIDEYDLNDDVHSRPFKINYLEYLHSFDLDQRLISLTSPMKDTHNTVPRFNQHVDQHELRQKFRTMLQEIPNDWARLNAEGITEENYTINYLNTDLCREMCWVLYRPILEQLEHITIPVSNIGQYLDNVDRLSSLKSIYFVLDELLQPRDDALDTTTEENIEKLRLLREKRASTLDRMVEFVRIHTIRFRGVLSQVRCPSNRSWRSQKQNCTEDHMKQIIACLEPLDHPTALSSGNWSHFLAHYHETDLGLVTSMNLTHQMKEWYGPALSDPNFLRRFRSLRKFEAPFLDPQNFKWAAEVRQQQISGIDEQVSLPPLQDMRLRSHWNTISNELLDDIALGFGPTLKKLTLDFTLSHPEPPSTHRIGYHWSLPDIAELIIYKTWGPIDMDPTFLSRCPTLRNIEVTAMQATYNVREIITGPPANLPVLYLLHLSGSPALSFHPDTLHSAKELRLLTLEQTYALRVDHIPSIAELEQAEQGEEMTERPSSDHVYDNASISSLPRLPRPKWSWDWYLPNIKCISLLGEFALRFKFRMLQGCPSIESLSLHIMSREEDNTTRELTEADFTIDPSSVHPSSDQKHAIQGGHPSHLHRHQSDTDWSMADIVEALMSLPLEPLVRLKWHLAQMRRRGTGPPRIYRSKGGMIEQRTNTSELRQNLALYQHWSLSAAQHHSHSNRIELQGYSPRGVLREEWLRRESFVTKIRSAIVDPVQREYAISWIRVFLADKQDSGKNKNASQPPSSSTGTCWLRVPTLQELSLIGYWKISDSILEIMLGQVFGNVCQLTEAHCTGFSVLKWLNVTQRMPWLLKADSSRPLGSVPWTVEDLPESLLTSKVIYIFDEVHYSFAEVESE